MSVTTEAKKRIRESETSRAIPSFAYIEGRWDSVSPEDVRQCMKIKPDDWKLAYHERADHRYRIAIQTIARHEERYIKEWIKHHLEIGVDHIFIYDNNAVSYPCLFLAGREIMNKVANENNLYEKTLSYPLRLFIKHTKDVDIENDSNWWLIWD